jgi:hypothetical protein
MTMLIVPAVPAVPAAVVWLLLFDLQDSPISPSPRVFYLAYKWAADHWPDCDSAPNNHVASSTAEFYLDGEETGVTMSAKIRLYNRAIHLVLCEYVL